MKKLIALAAIGFSVACCVAEVSAQAVPQLYMAGDSIMRVYPSSECPSPIFGKT